MFPFCASAIGVDSPWVPPADGTAADDDDAVEGAPKAYFSSFAGSELGSGTGPAAKALQISWAERIFPFVSCLTSVLTACVVLSCPAEESFSERARVLGGGRRTGGDLKTPTTPGGLVGWFEDEEVMGCADLRSPQSLANSAESPGTELECDLFTSSV